MPYLIIAEDAADQAKLRARARPEHLAYLETNLEKLIAAGARLTDDGLTAIGSMYIIDTDIREDAEHFIQNDPYMRQGLFSVVTVTRWRKGFLNHESFVSRS
ncbi:YciI family protein [Bosea sp. PAMC 26642]|uniref:YciI family protein n=1 Tax=Bosea sp. (strain PAMC 26642) TaxID=1792307 RepID=UPI0009ECAD7C|nr:YciI family protein [Bosea sp. PAMC 26642]